MPNARYTIKNTFHGTQVSFNGPYNADGAVASYHDIEFVEYSAHKDSEEYKSAHRKLLRIDRTLCRSKDCGCGAMIVGLKN